MNRKTFETLLSTRRPDLEVTVINGTKMIYRKDVGPAHGGRTVKSWKAAAIELELIDVEA